MKPIVAKILLIWVGLLLLAVLLTPKVHADDDDTCTGFKYEDSGAFLAHKNHDVIFRNGFENYCDDDDGDDDADNQN